MGCSSRHVSVNFSGGFGNQLFQFANALELSLNHERIFQIIPPTHGRAFTLHLLGLKPHTWYLPEMSEEILRVNEIDSRCRSVFSKKVKEKEFSYHNLELSSGCTQVSGYFQSYKYFSTIAPALRNWLIFRLHVTAGSRPINQVGLHVRLGDMANDPKFRKYHGIISDSYVEKAVQVLDVDASNLRVITESMDDLRRELPYLASRDPIHLMGNSPLDDFKTLVEFQTLIISNSTFSWWAAWLSNSRTVAPKDWFTPGVLLRNQVSDLIPARWMLL